MKIEPRRPTKKIRPWALLTPHHRSLSVIDSNGCEAFAQGPNRSYELLSSLQGSTLYTLGSLGKLRRVTGARCWEASVWRGKITSLSLDGTTCKVNSLRNIFAEAPDPYLALSVGLDWFADLGIPPGSLSQMAWSLWRSTLTDSLSIAFTPKVSKEALFGGRQEIRESRTFSHMKAIDIKAAYPHAMGADVSSSYASTLMEVSKETTIDPTAPGLARASVFVPFDIRHAPLPVRLGTDLIQWQRGKIEGTWSWCELAAAQEIGCEVNVSRCWSPVREVRPFGNWWQTVLAGRDLPNGADALAKACSSSLWGLFGMTGDDRGVIRWADDAGERPIFVSRVTGRLPHAQMMHIAAETAARVRRRMLLEGLMGPFSPVHVDTDGIIVRKSAPVPGDAGAEPGQWRVKEEMKEITIRAPQVYRYTCKKGCGTDHKLHHYVTAGVPRDSAEKLFSAIPKSRIAVFGPDVILPEGLESDPKDHATYLEEARRVQTTTYGRPAVSVR